MSTKTIRLPQDLKDRVAAGFHEVAEKRYSGIAASGKTIPWSEMRSYLENRIAGGKARRPVGKKLAR